MNGLDLAPVPAAREALRSADRSLGRPIAFGGCAGFLHPASGSTGVVMVGPWGYEALCLGKAWRIFAEAIAAAGYPVLRYDHPGSGDSLDPVDTGLDCWRAAFLAAGEELRSRTGVDRIVVVAQGLGAAVALENLDRVPGLAGFAALAPVISGRSHVRELQAWGAMVGGTADGAVSIAGLALPPRLGTEIGVLDLKAVERRVPAALVVARPSRAAEAALAGRLHTTAGPVEVVDFVDFEASVTDPTRSILPAATQGAVIGWLRRTCPPGVGMPMREPGPETLAGDGFVERGVRFGPEGRLFGVLCRPAAGTSDTAVLFLNAGRDPHTGWARVAVDHARRLAREGVASFRIALSATGESAEVPAGDDGEQIYSDRHQADVTAAVEQLAAAGFRRVVATGRCSGAYAALHAAPSTPGISGLVLVNMLRVIWDPEETVEQAISADIRPIGSLARKALEPAMLLGILTGRVPVANVLRRVAALARRKVPLLDRATAARRRQAVALVRSLSERGTSVVFVSGTEDSGLGIIEDMLGPGARRVAGLPGVSLRLIPDTDHNLNPPAARDKVLAALLEAARSTPTAGPAGGSAVRLT